jgi:exonuclease III
MTGNNRYFSILTLNVNGLNAPIKRHRTANWIKNPTICCLHETNLTDKNINTGSESKDTNKFSKQMDPISKQE